MPATFLGDGTTPRRTDPKRIRWVKLLMRFQAQAGGSALAVNDPLIGDPIRVVKQKALCSVRGTAYTG